MKNTWKKYMNAMKRAFENRHYYFQFAKEEIVLRNISRIYQSSIICIFLCVPMFIITPIVYPAWRVSFIYLLLLGFFVLCYFGCIIGKKIWKPDYAQVMFITMLFYLCIQGLLIYIDVVENQKDEAIFFPFMMIVLPIILVIPVSVSFFINMALEIIFMIVVWIYRVENLVVNDFYTSIFAFVVSIIVSNLVMNIRCEDNVAKYQYKRLSSVDLLTGTLNKPTCSALTEEYIKERRKGECFALMILDVDTFKNVNDKLGHQAGDVILQRVGEILLDTFRMDDVVGRVGGDEFMVLMKDVEDQFTVEERYRQVNERVRRLTATDSQVSISCSIGAIIVRNHHISYERCFSIADDALYEAKASGRDRFVVREELEEAEYKKPLLIIADDDEASRVVIAESFRDDFEVLQAKDGTETLRLVSKYYSRIAVILLDIYMPKMDGYQVIRYMKARQRYKDIPIIVVSGYTENEQQALELGIEDVIVKPINPDVAKLRVANVVRMKKNVKR